ncbi:MAG: hypothetical protein ABL892_13530, partial [Thiobacillaceae bacterium]
IVNGYPAATLPGIVSAAGLTSVFPAAAAQLATEGYAFAAGAIQVTGGAVPATCSFTYTAAAANAAPTIGPVATAGC